MRRPKLRCACRSEGTQIVVMRHQGVLRLVMTLARGQDGIVSVLGMMIMVDHERVLLLGARVKIGTEAVQQLSEVLMQW